MTAFSSVLTDFRASAPNYEIEIDENWKQGRTAYVGLTAALLHAAIVNSYDNLPPLRTAQINFVGPTDGRMRVTHKTLRRGKNNVTFEARLDSDAGPGTYGYGIEINKYGVYGLSTIENSRAAAWSPSKKRFVDDLRHKKNLPGPGDYDPSDQIGGTSQYLLSNFKSYGTRKYMPNTQHSSRGPAPTKSETPGPGTYQAPSDFGYLELNKPTSPRSPGRTARTATILSSRGGARRNSLMSHRNS